MKFVTKNNSMFKIVLMVLIFIEHLVVVLRYNSGIDNIRLKFHFMGNLKRLQRKKNM